MWVNWLVDDLIVDLYTTSDHLPLSFSLNGLLEDNLYFNKHYLNSKNEKMWNDSFLKSFQNIVSLSLFDRLELNLATEGMTKT